MLDVTLQARDGRQLAATRYGTSDRWVVIAGATGVPRGFYRHTAAWFAARGWSVVTFDYRGIGDSAPKRLRGFPATMADWGRLDLAGVLDWVQEQGATSIGLIGHSVGGQLLGLAGPERIDRVLFVASQSGHWRHWTGRHRLGIWFLWHVLIPGLTPLMGRFPARRLGIGEDLPADVARQWARWGRHPEYLLRDQDRYGYDAVRAPILSLSIADDEAFGPRAACKALLEMYRNAPHVLRVVEPRSSPIGHFGWFRKGSHRLWEEADGWLAATEDEQPGPWPLPLGRLGQKA